MNQQLRALKDDLESADADVVVRALHAMCPCGGSPAAYERLMPIVQDLKKDPRPEVRAVAIHVELDALQHLAIADERANGWVRNRAGGNPRHREARRERQRYG